MSSLQKSFAKAKLAQLPFNPPPPSGAPADLLAKEDALDEEAEDDELRPLPEPLSSPEAGEDDSSSASSASSAGSTNTIKPEPRKKLFARPRGTGANSRSHYTPHGWTTNFEKDLHLRSHDGSMVHHVYLSPPASSTAVLFVFHHGAGSSGLSFAACAAEMRKRSPDIGLLSLDARGHGETTMSSLNSEDPTSIKTSDPQQATKDSGQDKAGSFDLSLETLATDLETVIELTAADQGWSELPNLIFVGHSLGGAVVTHVAKSGKLGSKVLGNVVLDVVEGSAMDALQSMNSYLSTRPKTFPSIEAAIEWHTRTRTIRSLESARISVPSLLRDISSSAPTASAPTSPDPFNPVTTFPTTHPRTFTSGTDKRDDPNKPAPPPPATAQRYTWRTDLAATSPFWEEWFAGLSSKFLAARGGKLLLLAGTDRLDKELMIGQMQGKYQLQVYPEAGHFIHEDLPEKIAVSLLDFWKRNDGRLVLPPKVSALMKQAMGPG